MGLAAISALRAASAAALAATSPLVMWYFSTAWILLMAMRWVTAAAPSLEITTIGTPAESAIMAVVLYVLPTQTRLASPPASIAGAVGRPRARARRGGFLSSAL